MQNDNVWLYDLSWMSRRTRIIIKKKKSNQIKDNLVVVVRNSHSSRFHDNISFFLANTTETSQFINLVLVVLGYSNDPITLICSLMNATRVLKMKNRNASTHQRTRDRWISIYVRTFLFWYCNNGEGFSNRTKNAMYWMYIYPGL